MAVRDEVNAYLSAADIVAVPSVHADGFVDGQPNVALEAMAAGKPLVVTRVGGLPDLVRPARTGWIVEERDPDALARARSSPSHATRSGERRWVAPAGRAWSDELNWDTVADR